jgi:hypothetical protein
MGADSRTAGEARGPFDRFEARSTSLTVGRHPTVNPATDASQLAASSRVEARTATVPSIMRSTATSHCSVVRHQDATHRAVAEATHFQPSPRVRGA